MHRGRPASTKHEITCIYTYLFTQKLQSEEVHIHPWIDFSDNCEFWVSKIVAKSILLSVFVTAVVNGYKACFFSLSFSLSLSLAEVGMLRPWGSRPGSCKASINHNQASAWYSILYRLSGQRMHLGDGTALMQSQPSLRCPTRNLQQQSIYIERSGITEHLVNLRRQSVCYTDIY